MTVAILFVDKRSIYKTLAGVDCYDIDRDALTFPGGMPIVAHPPCRTWGRLRQFSTAGEDDHALAPWAVDQVREWGGVLEHPAHSTLWRYCGLPYPGKGFDDFGGWTMDIDQFWFGHLARKRTWLYIVGCKPVDLPIYTIRLDLVTHIIDTSSRDKAKGKYHYIPKSQRAATPLRLAQFLIEIAERAQT